MNDHNGCSTCEAGLEKHEQFWSKILGRYLVQYEYRTNDGRLFVTARPTLERCRELRDKWLKESANATDN